MVKKGHIPNSINPVHLTGQVVVPAPGTPSFALAPIRAGTSTAAPRLLELQESRRADALITLSAAAPCVGFRTVTRRVVGLMMLFMDSVKCKLKVSGALACELRVCWSCLVR